MVRRTFFGWLASMFGIGTAEAAKPAMPKFKDVFRWEDDRWNSIQFDEIRRGDRVMMVDFMIHVFVAGSDSVPMHGFPNAYVNVERNVLQVEDGGEKVMQYMVGEWTSQRI